MHVHRYVHVPSSSSNIQKPQTVIASFPEEGTFVLRSIGYAERRTVSQLLYLTYSDVPRPEGILVPTKQSARQYLER